MKKQKSTKLTAEWVYVVLAIILGVLIISFATSVRIKDGNFYPVGYDSYYNIRIANEILEKEKLVEFDSLSNGGRSVGYFLGWPISLAYTSKIFDKTDVIFATRFLPMVFALLSLIVLYFILRQVLFNKNERVIYLFLFVLSPPFIYMSVVSNYYSACMFFGLLSFYLYLKKKFWSNVLSAVFLSAVSLFSFFAFVLSAFIFGLYVLLRDKENIYRFFLIFIFSLIAFILYFKMWLSRFISIENLFVLHAPDGTRFYGINSLSNFIAEFGGEFGLGFFVTIISVFGLFAIWKSKYKYNLSYLMVVLLFFFSLYFEFALFYLNLFIIFLASIGLNRLIVRKFESQAIKYLVLLILSCGVIFDGLSYANSHVNLSPTIRDADMISFVKERTLSTAVIFSYYKNGNWISYAGKTNVIDSNLLYTKDYYTRWVDSNTVFHPSSVSELKGLLEKYRVDYIWIDKKSQKTIYEKDNLASDELPLLIYTLKNDKSFRLVFRNFDVELYRYSRS